ncbi:conjugative transposon protein TraM [Terrimonas alba]|uniref:conjugative transposon protein TraM n=1 Tax=Terrimonas alba TaxID=3349636 RepID=UPI0035F2A452
MNNVKHPQVFLRKRRMMMILPLMVIPFLTMAFWSMGGGRTPDNSSHPTRSTGLNLRLPNANPKDDSLLNKLSFYDQAEEDSLKLAEQMRNDPYYRNQGDRQQKQLTAIEQLSQQSAEKFNQPSIVGDNRLHMSPDGNDQDPAEEKVMQKLAELNQVINEPPSSDTKVTKEVNHAGDTRMSSDIDRLESMMQLMQERDSDDSEMKQLGHMLDKIIDIQHPERIKDRIKKQSLEKTKQVFVVHQATKKTPVSLLGSSDQKMNAASNAFYGSSQVLTGENNVNAVAAAIHAAQTVTAGSTVKLRLLTDIYVNGNLIPAGSFVFGVASLENERLLIHIPGIRYGNNLLPVSLEVYDMDGLPGIYIPGSISRDVAKQSAEQRLQEPDILSPDPSLGTQAAAAGLQAAKSLLSKKVKLVKVNLKAGYQVLLQDGNKQEY